MEPNGNGAAALESDPRFDASTPEQLVTMGRIVGMKANPGAQVLVCDVEFPISLGATRKVVIPYAQLYMVSGQLLTQMGEQLAGVMGSRIVRPG